MHPTLTTPAWDRRAPPPRPEPRGFDIGGWTAGRDEAMAETRGAELLAAALGGMAVAAFICDGAGVVRAATPLAEAVLERGILQLRRGRLTVAGDGAAALEAAIDRARRPGATAPASAVLRREDAVEVLDIVPLPRTGPGAGEPRVLVVVRGEGRSETASKSLMRAGFGLTPAESAIALQLAEGLSTDEIATGRAITVGTLRSHIKSVFCKIGVNRRAELVARLRAFR